MPEQQKKTPCGIGVLAHVDAGKTTISEAMLYEAGARRTLGRVDHQDAFLDTHALERARGITIFSKQALLETEHRAVTLVDTPGHVDFSAEAERIMPVLDCAVLVISGTDGVQAHTLTLWRLLERYQVPTFLFLNKMDLPGMGKEKLLAELRQQLSPACVDFTAPPEEIAEKRKKKAPAYRLMVPDEEITFTDGCMGTHTENLLRDCGDFYLRRADGVFAYQLAVVVDDARMGVTEVVRGSDLLSSTARQLYLYRLLGLQAPQFAHCPLLLAADGRRLSKRDGDQSLENLRAKYTAPEIIGKLAYAYGLQPEPVPRTPESLVPDFAWTKVPKQDICLPEGLF